jgi:HEAT repeat protein
MNRSSVALAVLFAAAVGVVAGAIVGQWRRSNRPDVAAKPTPPPPSSPPAAPAPDPEVDHLKRRVAELEAALAAKEAPPPPIAPPPPAPDSEKTAAAKLAERFAALVEKGMDALRDPDFKQLAQDLKKAGPKAMEDLAKRLLNAESATERFLAGALIETMGDAAAIPFLSESLGKDEDLLVRRMTSHALAVIGTEPALGALRAAMAGDSDWGVRVNSAYGVAKQGQPDGLKLLEEAYTSSSTPAEYKLAVYGGLADVAAPSSAPIFRKVLSESTDLTYLILSIRAVEKMKDLESVSSLNRIAGDAKYPANVREAAKKAADAIAK